MTEKAVTQMDIQMKANLDVSGQIAAKIQQYISKLAREHPNWGIAYLSTIYRGVDLPKKDPPRVGSAFTKVTDIPKIPTSEDDLK